MKNQYIQLLCQSVSKQNAGKANTEYIEITKEREKEIVERGQKLKAI